MHIVACSAQRDSGRFDTLGHWRSCHNDHAWAPMTAIQDHMTGLRASLTRLTAPQILFPLIALFLLAVIWSTTFGVIRVNDAAAARAAASSTSVLLREYKAQFEGALAQIDRTLNLVKFWPHRAAGQTLSELKKKGLLPPDLHFVVSIADAKGVIVDSTRPFGKQTVDDKDIFRKQRAGETFVIGRLPRAPTGDARLPFSRRLNDSNGAFDGIVIVSVDAAYFVSSYDPSEFGERGVLSMIGADDISQVRRTGDAVFSGEAIDYAAALPNPDAIAKDATVLTSSWDGAKRWTSALKLDGYPLAVLAGLSVDEQMAAAHRQERTYIIWAAFASVLVALLTAILGRTSWHLAQSREMFRLMAESTKAIPFTLDLARG